MLHDGGFVLHPAGTLRRLRHGLGGFTTLTTWALHRTPRASSFTWLARFADLATGSGASTPSPPGRYPARRESYASTRLARFTNLATGSGASPPSSPARFADLATGLLRPRATPHVGGSAYTWPKRLRSGRDYYARRLHRMLGAPIAPGRHDSALGKTTTPRGFAAR
uniref:Uncharacterized protein n=1 Tax=Oryza barthii TaxID=65489 RepID=A0A0D3F4L2_9ORYZ